MNHNLNTTLRNHEYLEPYHKTLTFTRTKNIFEEPTSLESSYPKFLKTQNPQVVQPIFFIMGSVPIRERYLEDVLVDKQFLIPVLQRYRRTLSLRTNIPFVKVNDLPVSKLHFGFT
ncbi:hypothetical protein CTI12_AA347770 [Artemisia annua]|uniref:Uncharacterized protein n=1 Tax=Artemisia annua TaxID=35608 RepID=A0A2U1MS31_ARTAN|nr:hypothetical protein CTI12_AA347770 [Artemisia annua]